MHIFAVGNFNYQNMDIKSIISAVISQLCTTLLALLGYNCSAIHEPECMYGTPTASFEVKGKVTDEESKPLEAAEIKLMPTWHHYNHNIATTTTEADGKYIINTSFDPIDSIWVVCIPADNAYMTDYIKMPLKYHYDKEHKKDEWYVGHAEITVDFKLRGMPDK